MSYLAPFGGTEYEMNGVNDTLALGDAHRPSRVLIGIAFQILDHLLAKGDRLVVVDQRQAAEVLGSSAVV